MVVVEGFVYEDGGSLHESVLPTVQVSAGTV